MSKTINMRLIQEVARMTADVFKEKNAAKDTLQHLENSGSSRGEQQ